ncbi:unnamed protein product, partial [Symbiodinium pilosum]
VQADFISCCSMAPRWEDAVEEVAAEAGAGFEAAFVFVSELYVDQAQGMAPVLEAIQERLDVEHVVGGACPGAIGQTTGKMASEYVGAARQPCEVEAGFVLSVAVVRSAGAVPFFLGANAEGDLALINRMAEGGEVRSMILLADPFGPVEDIMQSLDESFPKVPKAGGITTVLRVGTQERSSFMPSMAICSKGNKARLLSQGVCGLLLTQMDVHTVVCQGCLGVGPAVRITNVSGPVCVGIGGRPAKEALMLIFGAVDEDLRAKMQTNLVVGLGRQGESETSVDDGDWLIRGIAEVTPNGSFVLGPGIAEGQPLRFHVRDKESAEGDLTLMLKRYRLERTFSGGKEPIGSLLFTCNGRGQGLYGRQHVDARALQEALGEELGQRVGGFFCNGEIGAPGLVLQAADLNERTEVRKTALHGFTAVFAMLVPAQS